MGEGQVPSGTRSGKAAALVRPRPLHEAVVDRLRDMILDGDLAVGERLHDANLALSLGVSRTPVREAVKLLASEGLVDLLPGRGARVATYSLDGLIALIEVIAGLERHACELAAARMSREDLARLEQLHAAMAEHHRRAERHAYEHLNHAIHVAVVEAAGNATLSATHATLIARARRGRHNALETDARWLEAMAEHERLMEALTRRDGVRAGQIMLEHDLHTRDALVAQRRIGSAEPPEG